MDDQALKVRCTKLLHTNTLIKINVCKAISVRTQEAI